MFENLNDEDYPVKEVYFVGYSLVKRMKLDTRSKKGRQLRKLLVVLYGEKFVEYYLNVVAAQRLTMVLTVLALAAPIYFFSQGSLLAFVGVAIGAGAAYWYYGTTTEELVAKRSDEIMSSFSDVVSKLALLVNAGLILQEAWERTSLSGESLIYREMRHSVEEMRNGTALVDALFGFGQRCMLPEIRKFSSTLIQGVSKGNSELAGMLTQQSKEVWNLKRQNVHRQGELANSKLLLPMCVTFIGILIMIMVPIFTNLGV